jgi:isopropylmalate/homocitrate/citramalate synthase
VRIARGLDELGIQRIEAGMPVVSPEDMEAVKEIAHLGLQAEIWSFCRCVRSDIDACISCGVDSVVCEIPTSDLKMKAYKLSRESVINRIMDAVTYAKERGLRVAFFAVDATRAELDFLKEVYLLAVRDAHADEVVMVDTLGVALPEAIYYLTSKVREWVDVPIHVHCHNDFGLATACTLAAVQAGARCIHSTVLGIGEKAGNTDTAEVALTLELLCNVDTELNLDKLNRVSKLVEELSGYKMAPNKTVVGENVFKRESGLAVQQLVNYPPAVEGFAPELVGGTRQIVLGKKSGGHSVEWKLREMGVQATAEQVMSILKEVKSESEKRKGLINDEEFKAIARKVLE